MRKLKLHVGTVIAIVMKLLGQISVTIMLFNLPGDTTLQRGAGEFCWAWQTFVSVSFMPRFSFDQLVDERYMIRTQYARNSAIANRSCVTRVHKLTTVHDLQRSLKVNENGTMRQITYESFRSDMVQSCII